MIENEKMYCNNCGTQFEDGQEVCPNCGAAAASEEQSPSVSPFDSPSNNMKGKLPIIIIAAAVVVLIIVIVAIASSGGHEKAVEDMFKYVEKGKSEKLLALNMPKEVYEELIEEEYDMELKDYFEIQDEAWDTLWEGLKDEGKVKLSYEIKKSENINKLDKLEEDMEDYEIEDLDDFIDLMDEEYEDYDFDASKIKKAYAVEIKYTLTVDGDKVTSATGTTIVYKYKSDWYVIETFTPYAIAYSLDGDYEDLMDDLSDVYEDLWD